ncbi:Rieske (2Fe-2S) protein [Candidatus Methylacidiphilum infernorum]|uniref:Ferredoxin subunit of nitrite reductase n=1 Tax=Methylacidiphilum infernorum (isolate V4) TaxID=481448 RepID=A9QPH0_METI4|nr:Rieske (2Fe-2S) protein [Candidatus Methylacidiphilum infernorum]ABX56628.1 nitrite reductase small subunit [Methylacidiphilum infernorum V4]ACD83147.1 Ferredoxin subunit of nitrite reductase [Methylacidiphilum infernorum V4]
MEPQENKRTGSYLLCPIDELVACVGRTFKIGKLNIALFKTRSGKIWALDARCPHRGGPLGEALCDDQVLICPLHGYVFSLETGQCLISDKYQATTYPTFITGGWISIELSPTSSRSLSQEVP